MYDSITSFICSLIIADDYAEDDDHDHDHDDVDDNIGKELVRKKSMLLLERSKLVELMKSNIQVFA